MSSDTPSDHAISNSDSSKALSTQEGLISDRNLDDIAHRSNASSSQAFEGTIIDDRRDYHDYEDRTPVKRPSDNDAFSSNATESPIKKQAIGSGKTPKKPQTKKVVKSDGDGNDPKTPTKGGLKSTKPKTPRSSGGGGKVKTGPVSFEGLSEHDKTLMKMREEGKSYKEISEALGGVQENTLRSKFRTLKVTVLLPWI
jgi:hypothetical protein